MQLERTKRLIERLRAYREQHAMPQVRLAAELNLSPANLSEILRGNNSPNSETTLQIVELIGPEFMRTLIEPPAMPRASTRDPNEPRTLQQAKEMIEALRLENAQLKAGKTVAITPAPTAEPKRAGSGADSPTYPTTGPLPTPGADRLAPTPMPVNVPAVKKAALSEAAVSPVLCQRELDVADFDTVLSMLDNPVHTPMQQACIYAEVKKRRNLVANRFQ